jgi:hypothetical protein
MKINRRKILYISFIIAFLLITPSLILYSLGYTLNSGFKLQKSGILIIDSEPEGANILIDGQAPRGLFSGLFLGEAVPQKTPAKIKNIRPGEYEIRVELSGYWPWTKKLTINPGQSTFAEDINLFRNNSPIQISSFSDNSSFFSPDKKYFLTVEDDSLSIVHLSDETIQNAKLISSSSDQQITWSNNGRFARLGKNIIDLKKALLSSLADIDPADNPLDWAPDSDERLVYYENGGLFSFDLENKSNKEIAKIDNLKALKSGRSLIYYLYQKNNDIILAQTDLEGRTKDISVLPFSDYEIMSDEHDFLEMRDIKNEICYLVDTDNSLRPLNTIIDKCQKFSWINKQGLLYTDGHEISLFDISSSGTTLLARISDNIKALIWHPSNNYILYSTANAINILELDNREKHNITQVIEKPGLEQVILSEDGSTIYLSQEDVNNINLYKLFIQ